MLKDKRMFNFNSILLTLNVRHKQKDFSCKWLFFFFLNTWSHLIGGVAKEHLTLPKAVRFCQLPPFTKFHKRGLGYNLYYFFIFLKLKPNHFTFLLLQLTNGICSVLCNYNTAQFAFASRGLKDGCSIGWWSAENGGITAKK